METSKLQVMDVRITRVGGGKVKSLTPAKNREAAVALAFETNGVSWETVAEVTVDGNPVECSGA